MFYDRKNDKYSDAMIKLEEKYKIFLNTSNIALWSLYLKYGSFDLTTVVDLVLNVLEEEYSIGYYHYD